jgi:hypothetical protein
MIKENQIESKSLLQEVVDSENYIKLVVRSSQLQKKFKINRTDKFAKIIFGYCSHLKLDIRSIKFELDGLPLDPDSTPDDEDLEDGDIIDVSPI